MTIKIEKETRWNQSAMAPETGYFIWIDGTCSAYLRNEQEALDMVEKIKATYVAPSKEVIFEETI